jgi:hypothetical protein
MPLYPYYYLYGVDKFDCVEIAAQLRVFELLHKERFEAKL